VAVASARGNLGPRAIGFRKAMDIRRAGYIMAAVIPSKRSAERPAQREQSSNREVLGWPWVAKQDGTRVPDAATGSSAVEWNCPDIVERHVAEKRMAA